MCQPALSADTGGTYAKFYSYQYNLCGLVLQYLLTLKSFSDEIIDMWEVMSV